MLVFGGVVCGFHVKLFNETKVFSPFVIPFSHAMQKRQGQLWEKKEAESTNIESNLGSFKMRAGFYVR